MRKMSKLILALVLPVAILAGGNANAGQMITNWNYENLFGFGAYASTPTAVGDPDYSAVGSVANPFPNFTLTGNGNVTSGMPTKLSWGQSATPGQPALISSLTLSGNAGIGQTLGTVVTNGANAFDVALTHQNYPIYWNTLTNATLVGSLMLQATAPALFAGAPVGPLTGIFSIKFKETINGGVCADGLGVGNPCPDIFVIDQANSSPLQNIPFLSLDGYNYLLSVDISGLQAVGPESCAAVGEAAGCLGFITPEGESTTLALSFNIKAVPEPGVLALLGLGLVGLGFSRIRRRK
jgi:hypothetical protein